MTRTRRSTPTQSVRRLVMLLLTKTITFSRFNCILVKNSVENANEGNFFKVVDEKENC